MPHYHLFYMSCEDARTIESAVFEAPDDEAAVALIAEGAFPLPLELWSGYNRIRRFESRTASAQISGAPRRS